MEEASIMRVSGIRFERDATGPWSDYAVDSVNLLNKRFNPQGKYFYFDEVDVAQQVIGGHKVNDMYGWVIDKAERTEFEQLWLAEVDRHAAPGGSTLLDKFCDVIVTWEDRGGEPYALVECIIDYETFEIEVL